MSKPRYKWWSYVKWCIRDYPDKCREVGDKVNQSCVPAYGGTPGGHNASRATEDIVLGLGLSGQRGREYYGVREAILETMSLPTGADRLKLVRLVFFDKSHTLTGAGRECAVESRTAEQWHGDFIRCVAKHMGLLD